MKALIFDSGTLINLSLNGLLYVLEELKFKTEVRFFITKEVKYEIIDRPISIPRYELGALKIQNLLDSSVLELPSEIGVSDEKIEERTKKIMGLANSCVSVNNRAVEIVSPAEISCLALSQELTDKKIENLIAMDERTTRILCEKPEALEQLMSSKLHQKVFVKTKELKILSQFRFIRSTEIAYIAYKKGILKIQGPKALEAVLYATKFNGSSVSYEEINVLKKL